MRKLSPVILDLQGLVTNAYHADMSPEPLKGTLKENINTASYGFNNFLTKFFDPALELFESPLNFIAVVDDGNTYRTALFPEYKAGRQQLKELADPLEVEQLEICLQTAKNFLASLGIPLVCLRGQEADDVIAYLASNLKGQKTVITIDKDLIQLKSETCGIIRNGELVETYAEKGVEVPSHLISLYLSIVGDSSDGFPGIKGMGPKAWLDLVDAFGLDGMAQLSDLISRGDKTKILAVEKVANSKNFSKLASDYDNWKTQFELARLHPEICIGVKAKLEWYKRLPLMERLIKALEPLGMTDLVRKYQRFCYRQTLVTQDNLEASVKNIVELSTESYGVAWDYETYDPVKNPRYIEAANGKNFVDVLNSKITGCSFALGPNMNEVFYFSVFHRDTANAPQQAVLDVIKYFENQDIEMCAHNIGFEATVTKVQLGHTVKEWNDTRAFSHHVDENSPNGLKYITKKYFNYDQATYKETLAAAGAEDMSQISGEEVLAYGCDDSLVTGHHWQFLSFITQLEGTYDFIVENECPANAELVNAFIDGVLLNPEELAKQAAEDAETMKVSMEAIRKLLAEHACQPNFEAVDMLVADQEPYLTLKAKQSLKGKEDVDHAVMSGAIKDAIAKFKQKAKDGCRYIEPYEVRDVPEFIPTPKRISEGFLLLGLPELPKVTKSGMSDYIQDQMLPMVETNEEVSKALDLFRQAIPQFSKREGEFYAAFKAYMEKLYYKATPARMEGTELNFNSPVQMQHLLYLILGLPIRVRTKAQRGSLRHKYGLPGAPATDKAAVDFALANDCEGDNAWKADVLKAIQQYHKASTRTAIYWKPWPLWMDEQFVIHPSFTSPGTVTRRPTGSAPNLLQVSKGPVRRCIIPKAPARAIASVDFKSQELMVLADLTQDPMFLSAYTGAVTKDLHSMTACGILAALLRLFPDVTLADEAWEIPGVRVSYDWFMANKDDSGFTGKVLSKVRGVSKTINFGAAYGATGPTVSQQAMIPVDLATDAVDGMNNTYPGLNTWKQLVYQQARRYGYVATTYGSRRHCGDALLTGDRSTIGRWERQLSNFLIQGQCADLLKVVLAGAKRTNLFADTQAKLIAPIYDELLSDVPKVSLYDYFHRLADLMEIMMPGMTLQMQADCSFGPNWADQEEVGLRPTRERIEEALDKIEQEHIARLSQENPDDFDVSVFEEPEEDSAEATYIEGEFA